MDRRAKPRFLRGLLGLVVAASLLAVTTCVSFPLGPDASATGLPIPYVAWERNEKGEWLDFVGCWTPIAILLDVGVAIFLAVLFWRRIHRRPTEPVGPAIPAGCGP